MPVAGREDTGRTDREADRGTRGSETDDRSTWNGVARDVVTSALGVVLVGAFVVAISGVWPPLVAVESGSMEPNVAVGDLVLVVEESRFPGAGAVAGTGVVTAERGGPTDHERFGQPGDVVVFRPDGQSGVTPIIHRTMFYVEAGDNWVTQADPSFSGPVEDCADVASCPAPHAGFITKGDATGAYDQVRALPSCEGHCEPVKPAWVVGTAEVRVPALGRLRLERPG